MAEEPAGPQEQPITWCSVQVSPKGMMKERPPGWEGKGLGELWAGKEIGADPNQEALFPRGRADMAKSAEDFYGCHSSWESVRLYTPHCIPVLWEHLSHRALDEEYLHLPKVL